MDTNLKKFLTESANGPIFGDILIQLLEHYGTYTTQDLTIMANKTFQAILNTCGVEVVESQRESFVVLRVFGSYLT